MTEFALGALEKAIKAALSGASEWTAVYAHRALATAARPYVVYYSTGGGEDNARRKQDATFTFGVKCVADTRGQAMAGAAAISARLNDKGIQDGGTLSGGTDWVITTSMQERVIDTPEFFANADPIWHVGAIFRFVMEAN